MFISKVTLKQGPELFKILKEKNGRDGYIVHQMLWNLFPNDGDKKRDFIFHKDDKNRFPQYFLVSDEHPIENTAFSVATKVYSPKLTIGQNLAFTLNANPIVARKEKGKKNSIKHDVWMDAKRQVINEIKENVGVFEKTPQNLAKIQTACEDAVKSWLIRQGEAHGFFLNSESIIIDGYQQNQFYKKGKTQPIMFSSIHYEGLLKITDVEKFTAMLAKGIGRSKAFGCGLMLIRKA